MCNVLNVKIFLITDYWLERKRHAKTLRNKQLLKINVNYITMMDAEFCQSSNMGALSGTYVSHA